MYIYKISLKFFPNFREKFEKIEKMPPDPLRGDPLTSPPLVDLASPPPPEKIPAEANVMD